MIAILSGPSGVGLMKKVYDYDQDLVPGMPGW